VISHNLEDYIYETLLPRGCRRESQRPEEECHRTFKLAMCSSHGAHDESWARRANCIVTGFRPCSHPDPLDWSRRSGCSTPAVQAKVAEQPDAVQEAQEYRGLDSRWRLGADIDCAFAGVQPRSPRSDPQPAREGHGRDSGRETPVDLTFAQSIRTLTPSSSRFWTVQPHTPARPSTRRGAS
jgi:hypothetical protein